MKFRCVDDHWHDASPTALLMFCEAMLQGDTVKMGPDGVTFECLLKCITAERVALIRKRYKGNRVIVDGQEYQQIPRRIIDDELLVSLPSEG